MDITGGGDMKLVMDRKQAATNWQKELYIKDRIRKFIVAHFIKSRVLTLTDDTSLLQEGIIDSTGVMETVAFIQETFNIWMEDEEIIPDNFESVDKLTKYVQSKRIMK